MCSVSSPLSSRVILHTLMYKFVRTTNWYKIHYLVTCSVAQAAGFDVCGVRPFKFFEIQETHFHSRKVNISEKYEEFGTGTRL